MTSLSKRKTKLVFETDDVIREKRKLREIIIEAYPTHAVIRLKGMQHRMSITWAGIFNQAALNAANKLKAERAAKRNKKPLPRR